MKKIKLNDVFKCSPDMIFINASYRRKLLSKWVLLNQIVYKDPKKSVEYFWEKLHQPYSAFTNPDMLHWKKLIDREVQGKRL